MQAKPLRLFIAIELTTDVRQAIGHVQDDLKRRLPPKVVRWTNPDGIHLTLKFLGDTPPDKAPAVREAMQAAAAGFGPFDLRIAGFGCFPGLADQRVLWVGVPDAPKPLAGLQRAIDLHVSRLGFARDTRPFSAHLTLGRVNDHLTPAERAALSDLLEHTQIGEVGVMPVDEVVLFQSDLRPAGAVYTALARQPLAGSAQE